MNHRFSLLALPAALAAALVVAGGAGAESYAFSGVISGSGCSAVQPLYVAAPAALEADVATSAPGGQVFTELLGPGGEVLATGSRGAQAGTAGTYGVRVCWLQDPRDPDQISYVGNVNVGALSQVAPSVGAVAGVSATLPAKAAKPAKAKAKKTKKR